MEKYTKFADPSTGINPFLDVKKLKPKLAIKIIRYVKNFLRKKLNFCMNILYKRFLHRYY